MPKHLLLIGGGHSHIEVIRRLGSNPEPGVRVTLISPSRHTPYSGMLPGFIAGHYRFEDCHIDLDALCRSAGVERQEAAVSGIDPVARIARCSNAQIHNFDIVSIDTGSTPALAGIPGANRHGTPVKPVKGFLEHWTSLHAAASNASGTHVVVAGAGAGGIEITLAMQHRIRVDGGHAQFTIITDTATILASHPQGVRRRFERLLRRRGICVRPGVQVRHADAEGVMLHTGERIPTPHIVWVTGAAAPDWPRISGLQVDHAGFIAVNAQLQSLSHPCVFAAGDVASMIATPRPKSGVYAVRQGPPLAENLRRALRGGPLQPYRPQKRTLALISAGDRYAVASYGPLAIGGRWVWRWKDRIDTAFMRKYNPAASAGPTR